MTIRLNALCFAMLAVAGAGPLFAQETPQTPISDRESPRILHVTDRLNRLPEAVRSLEAFHANKAAGKRAEPAPRVYAVGMMTSFRVLKNLATSPIWETKEFELKATSDIANIWVETGELTLEHVTDADVAVLDEALLRTTPAGSIDATKGIVANNNAYFGAPPDVDGDGQLDILLYDISEGTTDGNIYIAGYVTSSDLSLFGGGNNKDILYLDTSPGLTSRPVTELLSTAAHEHQHLIHFNYDLNELTFVNEGQSEWAEVLNGYLPRPMTYLLNPTLYNIGLMSWEESVNVLDDYRRAGLYTAYLAERLGPAVTASITRNAGRGRTGYEAVLTGAGLNYTQVLLDYHSANLLNLPRILPNFGYDHPDYVGITSIPSAVTDGRSVQATPPTTFSVAPGAAQYQVWSDVQNFVLTVDTSDPIATIRSRMLVRVIKEAQDGAYTYEDLPLPITNRLFAGSFDRIIVQTTHVRPELSSTVSVGLSASWLTELTGSIVSESFDDGSAISGTFFSLSSGASGAVATRFDPPADSRLLEVGLAPFYLNQFAGAGIPADAGRDVELRIWAVAPDGSPGDVLFSKVIEDPRAYTGAQLTLNHFTIDLEDDAEALDDLPASYYIGYGETGVDVNYMVVGASAYPDEDRSFVRRSSGQWGALWETQFEGEDEGAFPLEGSIIPIRATFLVGGAPVANEDEDVLPRRTALEQNFPNPFTLTTTIRYELESAAHVRLTVYDLLGRPVGQLVDALQPAGRHGATFHAESLASGLYLYTLDTGADVFTRRMMLVK
ncbi:MAG: T9SS type A sorting domain-containing protein [Rhodothermales bacterium]|nr:T9SS type A sorting domain-containing protein [Rhodothermales bacterium]